MKLKTATSPTVTIVIPVYNEERHLEACLRSIEHQKTAPTEVIVVDNNSTDASVEIARRFAFVRVVAESEQGIVYARNAGFDAATGEIIARIDADTVLPSDWISRVRQFYQRPEHYRAHAYTGGMFPYNLRMPRVASWVQEQVAFRFNRLLLGHYILYGSNMAFPRHMWAEVKDQVCLRNDAHEDLDLSIHLSRLNYEITYHSSLRVGAKIRRVHTERHKLWKNLMMWPTTLRVHQNWKWTFGWIGAVGLYYASYILIPLEKVNSRLQGAVLEE